MRRPRNGDARQNGSRREDLLSLQRVREESLFALHVLLARAYTHRRTIVHLSPLWQTVSHKSRTGETLARHARRHKELSLRRLRPNVLDETERGGSQTHPYRRTAVRLQHLRKVVQAESLSVRAQSHPLGRVPL